jgi:sugar phosphate isomerase/epimerase
MNFKKEYLSNLDSTYVPQYSIGASTSPQTANQIAEATARLNAGISGVDISLIQPELFEQIPKEHFKEIDRLMKLTNAKATLHGPIVDLAGFTQNGWQEEARESTEKQVKFFVERAHDLDEKGNTPINFHINTGMPGEEWRKLTKEEYNKLSDEEKKPEYVAEIRQGEYAIKEKMGIVNRENGQVNVLQREVKEYPSGKTIWTPERRLDNMNQVTWDGEKLKVFEYQRQQAEINDRLINLQNQINLYSEANEKKILTEEEKAMLHNFKKEEKRLVNHIEELDTHIHSGLTDAFNQLKYLDEEQKALFQDKIKNFKKIYSGIDNQIKPLNEKLERETEKIYKKIENNEATNNDRKNFFELKRKIYENIKPYRDEQNRELQSALNDLPAPEIWTSADKLAKEKTVETVSNVIFDSYKKFKENTPIMVLENYQPMLALGKSEDMVETVKETRKKFAERLVKENKISMEEAKKTAEKLIGVTWDVGHINFLRKHGYSEEDVLDATKKIAPYVKQVHITDNFGFNDAHLPPGMGNAPIKEQLKILEKEGFKFEKGNVIVEAGAYVGQFKENPHIYGLEYFKSPLYTYETLPTAPYWKDIWEQEGKYGLGYGTILPEQHFQTFYGSGFSSLPLELGGSMVSDKSRFSGTPNQ